jgi:hypothetical protein
MNEPLQFDLSGPAHVVDPPIIDLLGFDADLGCYLAEFVPDAQVSPERKESVRIPAKGLVARRIGELLDELQAILGFGSPIIRLAHAGGGAFDIYTDQGDLYHLHESPSPQVTFDVYAVLQVIAQEVQFEFISQRRGGVGRVAG